MKRLLRDQERGNASIELVMLVPVLVALLAFLVLGGRITSADGATRQAANEAARTPPSPETPTPHAPPPRPPHTPPSPTRA